MNPYAVGAANTENIREFSYLGKVYKLNAPPNPSPLFLPSPQILKERKNVPQRAAVKTVKNNSKKDISNRSDHAKKSDNDQNFKIDKEMYGSPKGKEHVPLKNRISSLLILLFHCYCELVRSQKKGTKHFIGRNGSRDLWRSPNYQY